MGMNKILRGKENLNQRSPLNWQTQVSLIFCLSQDRGLSYFGGIMKAIWVTLVILLVHTPLMASEKQILREVARKYKATPQEVAMLRAIRNAEAGRIGFELGVEHPKAKGIKRQYSWALYEIRQNARRWYALEKKPCFVEFLALDYSPINKEIWASNVKRLYIKYTKGGA